MSRIRNFAFGCAMSIASVIAPMGAANAMPISAPIAKAETTSDVVNARVVCNAYRCWNTRPRYYRPRVYVRPRVVYRAPVYRGGYNRHVRWCLNRYRTYNPATNRYHAGGGVYPACRSPWG